MPLTRRERVLTGAFFLVGILLVGGGLRMVWQSVALRRSLRGSRILTAGQARELLDGLLRRTDVSRQVRLLTSPKLLSPAAFGLFRWTIVLPENFERKFDERELCGLLAHETAHLVRGDAWWLLIGRLLCTCFALQPLNFLACRNWQRASEYRCDDWAVGHSADPLALARCLTRVAEITLNPPQRAAIMSAAGSKSSLSDRVERLVEGDIRADVWESRFRRRAVAAASALTALVFACCAPRTSLLAEPNAVPVHSSAAIPEAPLPPVESAATLQEECRLLDEEINQLTAELGRVAELLKRYPSDAKIQQLTSGLRSRLTVLQRHRRAIAGFLSRSDDSGRKSEISDTGSQSLKNRR